MRWYVRTGACLTLLACALGAASSGRAMASDLLSADAIDQLAARRFWQTSVPIPAGDCVARTVLLDDNLYVLTEKNIAYAVHAMTGVIRWTALVADPGQTVMGPSHSPQYVFFTGPATVKVLDRTTGDLVNEPRALRGAIFDLAHDIATVSIGQANGIRPDDILDIYRNDDDIGDPERVVARLRVTVVELRQSKGEIIRSARTTRVVPGMRVAANIKLPLQSVKLPTAASCAAVADANNLFVGAANQRLYSLDILAGVRNWETFVSRGVSTQPLLMGENLYFASEAGLVTACVLGASKRDEARRKWTFETEGPILQRMAGGRDMIYVASEDRQLYSLDRERGRRVWSKRFDNSAARAPVLAGDRIYHAVIKQGLFCLDAKTGDELWRLDEPGSFLAHFEKDAYVLVNTAAPSIVRLDSANGKEKARVSAGLVSHAQASDGEQLILLADVCGTVMCIRPKSAPALKPEELAAVLRNDARARDLARMTAEQLAAASRKTEAEAPARPDIKYIDEDDLLGSRSTAKPAGGRGLVDAEEKPAGPARRPARDEEEDEEKADDDDADDDDDEESDDDDDSDDEDDEEDEDEDEDEDDDESDDDDDDR